MTSSCSPSFSVLEQQSQQIVTQIQVYDKYAQNFFLKTLSCHHCFMILTLKSGEKKILDSGKNKQNKLMQISCKKLSNEEKKKNRVLVQQKKNMLLTHVHCQNKNINLIQLIDKLKEEFVGFKYDLTIRNCYNVALEVLNFFNFISEMETLKIILNKEINRGCFKFGVLVIGAIGTVAVVAGGTVVVIVSLLKKK